MLKTDIYSRDYHIIKKYFLVIWKKVIREFNFFDSNNKF